jgi:sec-independent protein translocase protein TatA
MGGLSIWHWLLIIAVFAVLFGGRGKISGVMGDFAKGIKAFKAGMKDDDETPAAPPPQVAPPAANSAGNQTTSPADRSAAHQG